MTDLNFKKLHAVLEGKSKDRSEQAYRFFVQCDEGKGNASLTAAIVLSSIADAIRETLEANDDQ